jgi:hypothetical protein
MEGFGMSGNYSRNKGARSEVAVANWLTSRGFEAITSRNARGGSQGGADIICPDLPLSVEVKAGARSELAAWLDQARQQGDEDAPGLVVHRRKGKGDPGEWFATMALADLVALVERLRWEPGKWSEVPW